MITHPGSRAKATTAAATWQVALWVLAVSGFILALTFVWMQTQQIRGGYRLAQAQSEYHQQLNLKRKLDLTWAQLTAPQRLTQLARAQFQLAPPKPEQILTVGEAVD